jgi:hypothetical protein
MLTTTVLATFDGEVIRPDEPLAIPANTRIRVTVEATEAKDATPGVFFRTARSLNLDGPPDWSSRLDDYLYGGAELDD